MCVNYLSSHLIWTHPGLRRNDHGWYHFSTAAMLEHNTSNHKCSTCSLKRNMLRFKQTRYENMILQSDFDDFNSTCMCDETYFRPTHTRDLNLTSIWACAASWLMLTDCTAWEGNQRETVMHFISPQCYTATLQTRSYASYYWQNTWWLINSVHSLCKAAPLALVLFHLHLTW